MPHRTNLARLLITIFSLAAGVTQASAAILSVAGNDTLVGNRPANLIVNGSFEADGGVAANGSYWATGTGFSPAMSLSGWAALGQPGSYAIWGSDGLGGVNNSAPLPHGTNGVYFGAGIMSVVIPFPVEATNGLVTFTSSPPVIVPKPSEGPVALWQTVSNLNPSATYVLDFWTSGEDAGSPLFPVDGFFELNITGEPTLYFAAPSGNGPIGVSQRYQVYFTPTASTVTFEWVNWGHYNDPNGFSDELVLDDAILNLVTNSLPLCDCVTNLTATCPAVLPDLCAIAANCFGTNILAGSCTQNLPPGTPVGVGTYYLTLQALDWQSNSVTCTVTFTVNPPPSPPPFIVTCPTNKTVECGSGWNFDPPVVLSSCCGATMFVTTNYSTGTCPKIWTRQWLVTDGCGNMQACEQKVTEVDTTPPGTQCNGGNLVPNGSFEFYTNCPSTISQFDFAAPWFTPTGGTTDYYNSCAPVGSYVTTPTNGVGVEIPLAGQSYAGAALYSKFGTNPTNSYREYLEVPLSATLQPGVTYSVTFHVSRSEVYGQAIADIGALFFSAPLVNYGSISNPFTGVLPFTPHVSNPTNNIITATNGWTQIQGTYTATGGESYLILGNFRDDPSTTSMAVSGPFTNYAYYLFDDVSVVALCNPPTNKTVLCGMPWTFDEPLPLDACSGGNVTVAVLSTTTNNVCPRVITRNWALSDACGNTNYLSQSVTLVDTNPPFVMCAAGANLVPNPQFENFSYCPWFFSQVPAAGPWFNPTVATPDYFNLCTTFPWVSTPTNFGGSQVPFTGQAYAGAFVYSLYGTNPPPGYREYIETPLLAPLVAGMTYQVSFRVSLADYSGWAIADIGAHLSVGPVVSNSSQSVMTVIPQVVNPVTNLLTSTNSWVLIQGTFVAVGGEDHLTLGNFLDDASTTATLALGSNSPFSSMVDFSYYYFEDVAVVALCSPGVTNKTVPCGLPWNFDPPIGYDLCSGTNVAVTIASTVTNFIGCTQAVTRVWTLTDPCGNTNNWSQTVSVVDTNPPIPLCAGNNLVPNPQFESYTLCPTGLSLMDFAAPWYPPTDGTPDYFNTCAAPSSFVWVPTNFVGDQFPYTGNAYAGAYTYSLTWDYREYLQVPLLAPLVASQTYQVSFRVSLADNAGWAVANIGAHFSIGPVTNGGSAPLNVTPQVVNPSTNLLASSNAWVLISGTYTAAGGETHLTLGNFLNDASTTATPAGGYEASLSYYYFDDVRVMAPCTGIPLEKVVPCGQPWTFDDITGFDLCAGTNVNISFVDVTNNLCPLMVTRTWTLTDPCGNATNVTQMVIVTDNVPPVVNFNCLQDAAIPLLTTNGCAGLIPNLSVLINSNCITDNCGPIQIFQSPMPGTPVGVGVHPISVTVADCGGNGTNSIFYFTVNGPVPGITCPPNITVAGCSNNTAIVNYAASATGHVGSIMYSRPPGSIFALGTNTVTCTVTNSCGVTNTCSFKVIVRPPHWKFDCLTRIIGIKINLPPPVGRIIYLPDLPDGGKNVALADFSGTDGLRFDLGEAEKFTFTTVLDFNAATNASFELRLPPGAGQTTSTPLVRFERSTETNTAWDIRLAPQIVSNPDAQFRAVAINHDGKLFDSITVPRAALDTNVFARIELMNGASNHTMTVTLDCLTREITLSFPNNNWSAGKGGRKGWDGCIYGPDRPVKTNKASRIIITPPSVPPLPPITTLDLVINHLDTLAFEEPSITTSRRKWSDGHVTLMKAYDDGNERGMEFFAPAPGASIETELGHAASFSFRMTSLDTNGVPPAEQQFAFRGWPPGTTTNRPPPPVINVRLAPDNSGLGGVNVGAGFVDWGVSQVTLQLWNGTTLVAETNHVPATLAGTLVTLGGFPGIIGCPGIGIVSLSDTNPIVVASGLDCGTLGCVGTELRIIAETSTMSTPPTAYTGFSATIGEDMDYLIHRLQTVPACAPASVQATLTPGGIRLEWQGDGFHLQGAETVLGPWYDLNVKSPATIPASSAMRVFRLRCD